MHNLSKILQFEDILKKKYTDLEQIYNYNIKLFPYVYKLILLKEIKDFSNIENNFINIKYNVEVAAYISFIGKAFYNNIYCPLLLVDEIRPDLLEYNGTYQMIGFIDDDELHFLFNKNKIYYYKLVESDVNIYKTNLLNDQIFSLISNRDNIHGLFRPEWFNEKW